MGVSSAIVFSAPVYASAGTVRVGYAVTQSSGGTGYVEATTAALAASATGAIEGVCLMTATTPTPFPLAQDARVDAAYLPYVGTGNATDYAVVDANGKIVRSAAATALTIGRCAKDGSASIVLTGVSTGGATAPTGTGFAHVTGGVQDAAATAVDLATAHVTGVLPTANQAAQAMVGDVTGTTAASVVAKANGATVPAAGGLTTGNVLQVTGASALGYAAVNLAGGANYVTGILPVANHPDATTGAKGIVQLAQDLGGTAALPTVIALTGTAGVVDATTGAAIKFGAIPATTGTLRVPNNVTAVAARNSTNANNIPLIGTDGSNNVQVGDSTGATGGNTFLNSATGTYITVAGISQRLVTSNSELWPSGATTPILGITTTGSAAGTSHEFSGQNAATTGGDAIVSGGTGGTAGGNVYLKTGTAKGLYCKVSDGGIGWVQFDINQSWVVNATANITLTASGTTLSLSAGGATNQIVLTTTTNLISLTGYLQGSAGNTSMFALGASNVVMASDANKTLTAAQYATPIVSVTSSVPLTATRTITMGAVADGQVVIAENLTTGAQSLTFVGASGTGITVANAKRAWLRCNGTNWVRLTADV